MLSCGSDFLSGFSLSFIKRLYVKERDEKRKLRLLAAFHRKRGLSVDKIADLLSLPKRTVHGWLWKIEKDKLDGISDRKQSGRPKLLKESQLVSLRKDLLRNPVELGYRQGFWSTKLVQEHVMKKFKTRFVSRHITRLLNKIGFSVQKPRPSDYRANKAQQARFKKKLLAWYPNE